MANRVGRPPKKKNVASPEIVYCLSCGNECKADELYCSKSELYKFKKKIPYCRDCLNKIYEYYSDKYKNLGYKNPERKAIERICMALDVYYSDATYESALNIKRTTMPDTSIVALYFKQVHLTQYGARKDYDSTINERYMQNSNDDLAVFSKSEQSVRYDNEIEEASKFFGSGFSDDDYMFLKEQYEDWTTRHECETKSQEEIFKRICFKQLEILKATRLGLDTKDLDATFQKLLETAKLQPKQNSSESNSNAQTFGMLIDKWENTRPIPEIDEELRDVDKIGLYLDTFFKGHLARMMNLKNGASDLYTKTMNKYTVKKPEYKDDEDNEALFDAIFGNVDLDKDE